jgi:triacylglycerol lipase
MPNRINRIRRQVRRFQEDVANTATYVRLTLGGNKIEKVTDFDDCKHPILLLYGFGATRRTFAILERRLRNDGFCVFSLNLGGIFDTFNTRCIEELAGHVYDKIESLHRRYRIKKLSVIGHSKGGLIGRYYVQKLGGHKRVDTLITLGTPHHGNPWALLGAFTPLILLSKSLRQMIPLSSFIRRLKEGNFPKSVHFVSIFSRTDRVAYYKSSILDIPKNSKNMKNIELPGMSHADFVIRKNAYETIRKELLNGKPLPKLSRKTPKLSSKKEAVPA